MSASSTIARNSHGILDRLAIGLAAICAVHCLLMPILIVALPIIATSFFVHEDFHLWMILLVLPTTGFAIYMGFRKHKDRWVAALSSVGLSILIVALAQERMHASEHAAKVEHAVHCESCARDLSEEPIPVHAGAWFNSLGGLLLASAHVRNFRLCRKNRCEHRRD